MAEREVELKTEISGRVARIAFREGSYVDSGQLLVKLEDSELRAQLERAQARLMLAQTQEKRLKDQIEAQAASQRDYDAARADLQTAKADADMAKAMFDKTEIRAPFAGIAGLRRVDPGAVLQSGTKLTTLQDLASLRIEFSIPENLSSALKDGMSVRYTCSGVADTQKAEVYAIEPRIDAETRLIDVRARGRTTVRILPGAFARVELPLSSDSALWIPSQAVVQSARGSMVWRVNGGVAGLQPFIPGMRSAQAVEAARGLSAGDTILTSGLMQLRPGAPVIPILGPQP